MKDLHASGLVLISPLVVDVQEDKDSGRVRVTVKDVVKDKYVSQVQSKVIGSSNNEFVSGKSDLRGVFIADGIRGKSTVIAQATDGRYAFFRGKETIGPAPSPPQSGVPVPKMEAPSAGVNGPGPGKIPLGRELTEQLETQNKLFQQGQGQYLENNYKSKDSGVRRNRRSSGK